MAAGPRDGAVHPTLLSHPFFTRPTGWLRLVRTYDLAGYRSAYFDTFSGLGINRKSPASLAGIAGENNDDRCPPRPPPPPPPLSKAALVFSGAVFSSDTLNTVLLSLKRLKRFSFLLVHRVLSRSYFIRDFIGNTSEPHVLRILSLLSFDRDESRE